MNSTTPKISPLRQRMIEDMRLRKLATQTQSGYIRAVRHFAGWLGRSPYPASAEDLRRYQLHCVDRGVSPVTLNATITGLTFFFEVTLARPELMSQMSHVRAARTLPVILSREEASRLIESARTLKHRTALVSWNRYEPWGNHRYGSINLRPPTTGNQRRKAPRSSSLSKAHRT